MPDAYTLHVRQTRCQGCGAIHTSSELFIVDVNDRVRKMQPARDYVAGSALDKIILPVRTTPLCHACVDTAPTPDYEAAARFTETIRKKQAEARNEATREYAKKRLRPIEELA